MSFVVKNFTKHNTKMPQRYIRTLHELLLTDFIACCVYGQYEVLLIDKSDSIENKEQKEELQNAWLQLLSQYHTLRNDTEALQYATLIADMERIAVRMQLTGLMAHRLQTIGYDATIADALKGHTGHNEIEFSESNCIAAIAQIAVKEKRYQIEYEGMKHELNNINESKTVTTEKDFYKTVMRYDRTYKTAHKVKDLTAYEYALMCEEMEGE